LPDLNLLSKISSILSIQFKINTLSTNFKESTMPLAHISLPVTDLAAATDFYLAALKPLGYTTFMKLDTTIGMNVKYAGPDFWLHQCPEAKKKGEGVSKTHVAFVGNSKKAVHAFYEAAL
jgi:catechol 2,3-dioxygenase-like lactoylglutathione lyase family enzyme